MGAAERTRAGAGEKLVVAGWVLEERLGSGGYGEVWRAHRRHLDLQRALKLVRISDDETFEGWRQEISRLEELSHPNVVRFYDADLVTDGPYRDHAWIATELCERSLAAELRFRRDRSLTAEEAEQLLDQMLDALSAALTRGCVHRDVKPANILRHASGVWKLCDFGTARLLPEGATHPVTQVIGTSPYMSAGALRGQQNHAADLYALGVTLHEALCGRLLHPRQADVNELEYTRLVLETPPAISTDLPRRWQTTVAALTGSYGDLSAPALATWFASTRGAAAPPPTTVRGPSSASPLPSASSSGAPSPSPSGSAPSAAASVAPSPNGVRGRPTVATEAASALPAPPPGGRTAATEAAANGRTVATELANGGSAGAPIRQVFVPAPKDASAASPASPAPSPAPPAAPAPLQPWRPAPPGQPAAPRPATAPPPVHQPGARLVAAVDPTRVLRRRVVAFVIDVVFTFLLSVAWYFAVVLTTYDQVPDTGAAFEDQCRDIADQVWDCFTGVPGAGQIYVADEPSVLSQLRVVGPMVLVFVVLQGLTGYTPGKLVSGLRVVGIDRRPPGMRRAFVRTVLWVVDGIPCFVPLVGLVVAARRRDRRRVGDLVAHTWVVDRHPPPPPY